MVSSKRSGKKENLPKGISRLPSGSYRVQISHKSQPEPIRKTFELIGRDTKENRNNVINEAEAWALEARRSLKNGTFLPAGPVGTVTIGTALQEYLNGVVSKKTSRVARKNETNRIISMQEEHWAKKNLLEFKQADVVTFREALKQRGWERSFKFALKKLNASLKSASPDHIKEIKQRIATVEKLPRLIKEQNSTKDNERREELRSLIMDTQNKEGISEAAPTTVKNKMTLLSSALKYAGEGVQGFVNPVPGTTMPANRPGRDRRLIKNDNLDEETALLIAAQESCLPHLQYLIRMAIYTALRLGRIVNLKWEHIQDINTGGATHQVISIPKSIQSRTKRAGTVPVYPEIKEILTELKKSSTGDYVFSATEDQVEYHFRVAREKAGLENFTFHDLRHEATSRLFERGLSAVEVMSITGHSTNEMLDRYTHYPAIKVLERIKKASGTADDVDVIKSDFVTVVTRARSFGISLDELMQLLPNQDVGAQ